MSSKQDETGPLLEHVAECDECREHSAGFEEIDSLLRSSAVEVDAEQLSSRAMVWLRPELETNASEALWRRAVTALTLSVAPLPAILAWDAFLLRGLHAWLGTLLPIPVATYVTFSYAALLALLLAGTYAAIPITIGRGKRYRLASHG